MYTLCILVLGYTWALNTFMTSSAELESSRTLLLSFIDRIVRHPFSNTVFIKGDVVCSLQVSGGESIDAGINSQKLSQNKPLLFK